MLLVGKTEQGEEILDNYGIEYGKGSGKPKIDESLPQLHSQDTDSPNMEKDDRYVSPGNNGSHINLYASKKPGTDNIYIVDIRWTLIEDRVWISTANTCPPDSIGIFWQPEYWQPVSINHNAYRPYTVTWTYNRTTNRLTTKKDYDRINASYSFAGYNSDGGYGVRVSPPEPNPINGKRDVFSESGSFELKKMHNDSKSYPMKVQYKHRWKNSGCYTNYNLQVGVGGVGISGGSPKEWPMATSVDYWNTVGDDYVVP